METTPLAGEIQVINERLDNLNGSLEEFKEQERILTEDQKRRNRVIFTKLDDLKDLLTALELELKNLELKTTSADLLLRLKVSFFGTVGGGVVFFVIEGFKALIGALK
jgi:DNA repair exonuclease SbcCD ATPase subunit